MEVERLLKEIEEGKIQLRPFLRIKRWPESRQKSYILALANGKRGDIFYTATVDSKEIIVDGVERIETILRYAKSYNLSGVNLEIINIGRVTLKELMQMFIELNRNTLTKTELFLASVFHEKKGQLLYALAQKISGCAFRYNPVLVAVFVASILSGSRCNVRCVNNKLENKYKTISEKILEALVDQASCEFVAELLYNSKLNRRRQSLTL